MSTIPTPTRRIAFVARGIALCFALGLAGRAEEPKRRYDIAAGDAVTTLRAFSEASGREILYTAEAVRGVQTNAVHGNYAAISALNQMVAGTPLVVVHNEKTDALGVRQRAAVVPKSEPPVRTDSSTVAKTAPLAARSESPPDTLLLDPFEVKTSADTSYGALNSNSVTRFNTELDKTPVSADILSAAFMQDVDATSINALLTGYGAGVGTAFANPAGQSAVVQPGDRQNTSGFTKRGLNTGPIRLNGFVTEASNFATTTNFDLELLETINGPQGLLYGPGGAGGTIVATTQRARFNQVSASVSERIDQFGSKRTVLKDNAGNKWIAGTFAYLNEEGSNRRLFYATPRQSNAFYGQVAVKLPFKTVLRTDYQYTHQNLNVTVGGPTTISFGGVANDPRNGQQLNYLLLTGQAGAINPATGAPFSKYGAIDNGNLSWNNVYSFPGASNWEIGTSYNVDVIADTVWSKWLSTNISFNYNRLNDLLGPGAAAAMSAPLTNGNPYNDWAMNYTPSESVQGNRRHKNFRAAALLTNEFFGGRAKSQTSLGYDFQRQGKGGTSYGYYLSDANGNLILTPGGTNLGRTPAPAQWWVVGNGPVYEPPVFLPRQAPIYHSPQDGKYYVRMVADPTDSKYITSINPWGLTSLAPGVVGVTGGLQEDDYEKEITTSGLYLANYTNWWSDKITTMFGFRYTRTANNIPNTSPTVYAPPYDTATFSAPSYNLGVTGRITGWLRWYYDYSANYNVFNGETDYYGRPVDQSKGSGQEIGLKFTPLDGRISGAFDLYVNKEKDYAVNSGGPASAQTMINPVGLNGQFEGTAGVGTFMPESRTGRGAELVLNANPTRNWRLRFSAAVQDGRIDSDVSYGILYNDQFHTDGKGNVTYTDGSAFVVPAKPGTNVSSLSTTVNPNTSILAGVATQPLTTAMLGDPSSPYYVWQGGSVATNGQILSTSNVGRVLKNFSVPGAGSALTGAVGLPISAIQYAWPDPARTGGQFNVARSGQDTVGYPVYSFSMTTSYQILEGPLRGLAAVVSVNEGWKSRTYYYTTNGGPPVLWSQNALGPLVNLSPYYEHKFGRYAWRTQLNIVNVFNRYTVEVLPNNGAGFTNPNNLSTRLHPQPREYSWTNTISF